MTRADPAPPVFDPFAPGYAEDPYPHYARLRALAPVHHHPLGFWVLSTHADVARLHRGHSVSEANLVEVPAWKGASAAEAVGNRPMLGRSLLDQDPPDHTRLRRLVAGAFTHRAVDALEPRIAAHVETALDRIAARLAPDGRADVVAELAFPLPFTVISELLGVGPVDETRLRELTGTLVLALEPLPDAARQAAVRAANAELTGLVGELVAARRNRPGDDLLTALIRAEHDGDVLDPDELVAQVMLLYVAGHETTVTLLAGGILALLRHPDQARLLRERPELAAAAVEELLRYDTPVQLSRRITVSPLPLRGTEIPAGAFVVAVMGSANRDPAFWGEDADRLRLDRPGAHRHVSFGSGAHHCLGAALARLQARTALTRFVRRFPGARLQEVRWNGRINLRGPAELVVSAEPDP